MNSTEMLDTYETLSELTGTMLTAARQGEWDALASLEERCRAHVGALMESAPTALTEGERGAKVAITRALLQSDAQTRALADPRLHELQARLSLTRTGQRGVRAYTQRL